MTRNGGEPVPGVVFTGTLQITTKNDICYKPAAVATTDTTGTVTVDEDGDTTPVVPDANPNTAGAETDDGDTVVTTGGTGTGGAVDTGDVDTSSLTTDDTVDEDGTDLTVAPEGETADQKQSRLAKLKAKANAKIAELAKKTGLSTGAIIAIVIVVVVVIPGILLCVCFWAAVKACLGMAEKEGSGAIGALPEEGGKTGSNKNDKK